MAIRGITFDLDGTLADTLPVCYAAFRRTFLEHVGREYADSEIHAMFGPCEEGVIRTIVPDWRPAYEMFLREYEAAHDICLEPFPGVEDLLDRLQGAGIATAVVTGKGPGSASISLRRIGLAGRFEIVEAGSPNGAIKSDAIRRIIARWGFNPGEVAHVGDAPSDVRAAREAGVLAVAAAWATTAKRDQLQAARPDAIFDSVAEMTGWIQPRLR